MEEASFVLLALFGIVAFNAYRQGHLPDLLRSKFLNSGSPLPVNLDTSSTAGSPTGVVARLLSGVLQKPLAGSPQVTSAFGERRANEVHEGVDFAVPVGTPVMAAGAGRVIQAGPVGGYGNAVYIDHGNGLVTRYGHLSSILVRIGDVVTGGARIALSGNTGRSTGAHLHFEVRENGTPVDPLGALANPTTPATAGVLA
jgi:murein DD-endopeptidase MepM/ murein hydrolase activator NlpD